LVRAAILSRLDRSGKAMDKALAGKWICPMHPGEIRDDPGACPICGMAMVPTEKMGIASSSVTSTLPLVIPASAVLQTGKRAVVYVRNMKAPLPTYALRKVTLGPRAGAWYVVDKGLVAGEQVVVRGAFKIDSERQLRGLPSMMSLSDPSPVAATPPPSPTVHATMPHAFSTMLKDVLASYLNLQKALASDDDPAAHAATVRLSKAIHNLPVSALNATQQAVWKETASDLTPLTKQALAADGLAAKREAFHALSKGMLGVVRVYGVPDGATLYLMHCPMAFGNAGASWLQMGNTLTNPYFGAAMLRCGEQRQKFTSSEVAP
jgi:Cu(I)/Ag(I) efflux system membrane fusion protein